MKPFLLQPAFQEYLWGGTKLKTSFGKSTNLETVAESWELSAHPSGESLIADGPYAEIPFSEFVKQHPEQLGTNCQGFSEFPLLIKLIDAKESLSIQVHPDDAYARRMENSAGKTEMWIVLENDPDAFLYFGFTRELSKEEMRQRIEDQTITEVLRRVPVKPGDVFFIRSGTIHAIGAGILLAEIQQNSNTTYRVFDFGRKGTDGKPRQLHIRQALDVTNLRPADFTAPCQSDPVKFAGGTLEVLAACPYFTTKRLQLHGDYLCTMNSSSFLSLFCVGGSAVITCEGEERVIHKGDSLFIPATTPDFKLCGTGEFLLTSI